MNPHIQEMGEDYLYHLSLGSGTNDLKEMFGDVRSGKENQDNFGEMSLNSLLEINLMYVNYFSEFF